MKRQYHIRHKIIAIFSLLLLAGGVMNSCGDPLSVETDRRIIPVNLDSVLLSEPFLGKPSDTLFATVDGIEIDFTTELLRPIFYNRSVGDAWYLSVQGVSYDLLGSEYEILALRMDGIQSPGIYQIGHSYSLPKKVDPSLSSEYGGRYAQRRGGIKEEFTTTSNHPDGEIRVLAIDTTRGIIVGRFHFTAYNPTTGKEIQVEDGAFRLHLNR